MPGLELEGKRAIVTGAAGGIGLGIATALVEAGGSVAVVDRDASGAERAADGLCDLRSGSATSHVADLGDASTIEAVAADAIRSLGGLDVLVNNAAIYRATALEDLQLDEWDQTIAVNLRAPMLLAKATVGNLAASDAGAVINVTSIGAELAAPGHVAYSSAKGGLKMLTKVLAVELASRGIRVNAIAPHAIDTAMLSGLRDDPEMKETMMKRLPRGRLGTPADVGRAAVFLASGHSDFVTGATLQLDGGTAACLF